MVAFHRHWIQPTEAKEKRKVPGRIWNSLEKEGMAEEPASGRVRIESSPRFHKEKIKKKISRHFIGLQSFPGIYSSPESYSQERE